jgi:amino acid permease
MNWILFGIYLFCIISLFAFIAIVIMHIGEFRQYSRYINPILRLYVFLIVLIALFGGYKVLTDNTPSSATSSPTKVKMEF